ncbi:MAG TPA: hypothetical protein VIL85_06055 [Thermomicrobiales bacterium]|jgi:hypothetical protein
MRTSRHVALLTLLTLAILSFAGCGTPPTPTSHPIGVPPIGTFTPTPAAPNSMPTSAATPSAGPPRGTSTPAGATATRVVSPRATASTVGASPVAGAGGRLVLRLGQSSDMAASGLTLRFAAVAEDSRCPRSSGGVYVACAWSGQATVVVDARRGAETSALRLTMYGLNDDTTQKPGGAAVATIFAGYRIQLVSLEPQPTTTTGKPDPGEYVVTLLVSAVP